MKNKKSLLSLGLLALVLVLGVGYAVVSSVTLTFKGSAKGIAEADLVVDIESVKDETTGSSIVEHSMGDQTCVDEDTFTITNMTLNETVTMTYTVKNHENDIDATLTGVTLTNNNSEYFEVDYSITDVDLGHGEETTIVVTVELIKTPVVDEKNIANIIFTVDASPVNNANK